MKNTTILFAILLMIALVGSFIVVNAGNDKSNSRSSGNVIAPSIPSNNNEVQKVTLSMKNFNYDPQVTRVKANQPVEITLDNRVYGCLRAFTIRALGVSKYSRTPDDVVTFIPTQKGTFGFSCSMGMGTGTLIVE